MGTNILNTSTELAETFSLLISTVGKNLAAEITSENISCLKSLRSLHNIDFP